MQKTVGILGGMGPYATLDFCRQILENTPVKGDKDHIRMIIDNNTKIPSRTRAVLYREETPVLETIKAINNLALAGAEFAVLPCNSVHYWYNEVKDDILIPWHSMVDIVSKKVAGKKALILGAYIPSELGLYDQKVDTVYLKDKKIAYDAIYNIKQNGYLKDDNNTLLRAVNGMYKEFDVVLLACTEFTVFKKELDRINIPYVDSSLEYAKWVVEYATDE